MARKQEPKVEGGITPEEQEMRWRERRALEQEIVSALPANLAAECVKFWQAHPGALAGRIRRALEQTILTCELYGGGGERMNVEQLIANGKYTEINPLVNPMNFPDNYAEKAELEFVKPLDLWCRLDGLEDAAVNLYVHGEDVLREAEVRGLTRPTYIQALAFGASCLSKFADGKDIVFLHEPQKIKVCKCHSVPTWKVPKGGKGVLVFRANAKRRELDVDSPKLFNVDALFPFVRSRKNPNLY